MSLAQASVRARAQQPPVVASVPVRDTVVLRVSSDSASVQLLELRSGARILGRVARVTADSVEVRASYGLVTVARGEVAKARDIPVTSLHDGAYWFDAPNPTRLLFGPTGRTLARGDAYVADHWLFLVSGAYGVTDRFTLGGGMTLLPSGSFLSHNLYYVMPKFAVVQRPSFNASVGAFVGTFPTGGRPDLNTLGIGYAAATWGDRDISVTSGVGYGFVNGRVADKPALLLGTELRFARRASFVSENYVVPSVSGAVVSYGVRLMGESLSVDLAFVNIVPDGYFPGLPFLGMTFRF
jgi:hypothetical protein